jgi:hypothetical protein
MSFKKLSKIQKLLEKFKPSQKYLVEEHLYGLSEQVNRVLKHLRELLELLKQPKEKNLEKAKDIMLDHAIKALCNLDTNEYQNVKYQDHCFSDVVYEAAALLTEIKLLRESDGHDAKTKCPLAKKTLRELIKNERPYICLPDRFLFDAERLGMKLEPWPILRPGTDKRFTEREYKYIVHNIYKLQESLRKKREWERQKLRIKGKIFLGLLIIGLVGFTAYFGVPLLLQFFNSDETKSISFPEPGPIAAGYPEEAAKPYYFGERIMEQCDGIDNIDEFMKCGYKKKGDRIGLFCMKQKPNELGKCVSEISQDIEQCMRSGPDLKTRREIYERKIRNCKFTINESAPLVSEIPDDVGDKKIPCRLSDADDPGAALEQKQMRDDCTSKILSRS